MFWIVRSTIIGSPNWQSVFLNRIEDHQSLVGTAPAGALAVTLPRGGRDWHLLVTRNAMLVDRPVLERDCAAADIVISDRGLPWWCRPRWMKIDRRLLSRTGGLSIGLESGKVHTVHRPGDAHPWIVRPAARRRVSGQFGGR